MSPIAAFLIAPFLPPILSVSLGIQFLALACLPFILSYYIAFLTIFMNLKSWFLSLISPIVQSYVSDCIIQTIMTPAHTQHDDN